MKIALCPFNPVVGDIYNNLKAMRSIIDDLIGQNVELVIFPELALCGYPPKDLLDKPSFIQDNRIALDWLCRQSGRIKILVGFVDSDTEGAVRRLYNAAGYLSDGRVVQVAHKTLLPTYDVFDEHRYFTPGSDVTVIEIGGKKFGISICEDLWFDFVNKYKTDPIAELKSKGIDYLINMSASPFEEGKLRKRFDLISSVALKHGVEVLYVNQLGGNDGLIFDGGAVVFDQNGHMLAQAKRFNSESLIVDISKKSAVRKPVLPNADTDVINALTLGLRDYVRKTGFSKVVIGLSGGIDSALTAALAVLALGKDNVVGVSMPSRFSSEGSVTDAEKLARNLGMELYSIPIEPLFEAYLNHLRGFFHNKEWDITEENIQARIRGDILMALSNKHHWLVLATGNKSELAVGYCTLYGDMCGGLAVISDIFKTRVYEISRAINKNKEIIPESSITKAPSAELRHSQTDQDSLPPYPVLDAILKAYIEQDKGYEEIVRSGYDRETVLKTIQLVDRSEYKRKQAALGLKVSVKAFGEGRRIPVVQNYVPLDHCAL